MGRKASTEPQGLYKGALYLYLYLSACTKLTFTFFLPYLLHAKRCIDKHEKINRGTSARLRTRRNEIRTRGTVAQKNCVSSVSVTIIEICALAATVVCLLIVISRYTLGYNYKDFFGVSQADCSVRNHCLRSLTFWRRNYFFFLILAHSVYKM